MWGGGDERQAISAHGLIPVELKYPLALMQNVY